MSTIVMKDEIEQVCDALLIDLMGCSEGFHRAVFDQAAYAGIAMYGTKPTIKEQEDTICAWANRVYVANQCAYIFTYAHRADCNRKIDFIADSKSLHNGYDLLQNPGRLYRMLESIRYNLYSNGGQLMLCREDMERLDTLIEWVGRAIVGEYQKGKAKV